MGGGAIVGGAALAAVGVAVGVLSVASHTSAILVGLALVSVGLAANDLSIVALIAVPASLIMVRAGGFLSVADVVLTGACVIALMIASSKEARALQPLVWLGIVYLASLVPTLVLNPYASNVVEWVHEAVLILGSLVVGWVVGREGHARTALSSYVLACVGIAIAAVVVAVVYRATHPTWSAVYLPYMHKNFIGNALSVAIVLAYAHPSWVGWTRRWAYAAIPVCALGIAASQSRQAMLATVVGLLIVSLRPRVHSGRRSRLIWFALVPVTIFVINAVNAQLKSSNEFNSVNQRITWFGESIDIWHQSPIFGVGLRWWYTDRFGVVFQPPNAEFEMLTSGGVVGLIGFLVLFSGAAWLLTTMDPRYGTVALAVVVTRFTQGQFDLYWVAGQASLLWIVAGIAYGVQKREEIQGVAPTPAREAPPPDTRLPHRVGAS